MTVTWWLHDGYMAVTRRLQVLFTDVWPYAELSLLIALGASRFALKRLISEADDAPPLQLTAVCRGIGAREASTPSQPPGTGQSPAKPVICVRVAHSCGGEEMGWRRRVAMPLHAMLPN